MIDEFTREALAIEVDRSIDADHVVAVLERVAGERGGADDVVLFQAPSAAGAQVIAGTNLVSPNAFDIDVGTLERVDAIHAAAHGNAVVMGPPEDFPDKGIRCCLLIDPNGVAINVVAPLRAERRTA